jgi:hypothetical protein
MARWGLALADALPDDPDLQALRADLLALLPAPGDEDRDAA